MKLRKIVTVALVGMGGYGVNYVREILNHSEDYDMECVAMVDPFPEKCILLDQVKERGIPIYSDIETLYQHHVPELVFISTPIQFHCRQTCFCLKKGSHVLCEKPAAATYEDALLMAETARETGRFAAIGFQLCYNSAILAAKKDILAGRYGKVLKLKAIVGQRRNLAYFQRGWAGKIKSGEDYIYDNVANNSSAHYLNNLLFMAGEEMNLAAFPKKIEAECYRGNHIETYDTITARITTENDIDLYFAAFQCGEKNYAHRVYGEFERGTIEFEQSGRIVGRLESGEVVEYGNINDQRKSVVQCVIEATRGEDTVSCDVNTALPHAYTIRYIQEHVEVTDISSYAEVINVAGTGETPEPVRCVRGLNEAMVECFRRGALMSEL